MLLAIDIGNTQTVVGVYDGAELRHMWRMATNKNHTSDELRMKLAPLIASEGIKPTEIDTAALASVVPQLTHGWQSAVRHPHRPRASRVHRSHRRFRSVRDHVRNPAEIGADRVADAVAARALYGAPVVVVDFGTATNIEVIDGDGRFVGGIIAPGMESSATALFSKATRLAAIELEDPHTAIGRNTAEAMQAGIVYGEADRVDGLVGRVFAQLGDETPEWWRRAGWPIA